MDIGQYFDQTLNKYGISAAWLSRQSGVTQVMISRFRNGKTVQTNTLGRLLEPLPLEVKQYFFSLVCGSQVIQPVNIDQLVSTLDSDQLSHLLVAVSERVKKFSSIGDVAKKWQQFKAQVNFCQKNALFPIVKNYFLEPNFE